MRLTVWPTVSTCSKLMHNFVHIKTKFDEVVAFLCHGNHKMFLKDVKRHLKDLKLTLGRYLVELRGGRREENGEEGGGSRVEGSGGGKRMEGGGMGRREEGRGWREEGGRVCITLAHLCISGSDLHTIAVLLNVVTMVTH